jgi:hypothetical protein
VAGHSATWPDPATELAISDRAARRSARAVGQVTGNAKQPTVLVLNVPQLNQAESARRATSGIIEGVSTQTQTLPDVDTRPEGTDTTGDDTPKMFHYVKKDKIAESAVMGSLVVALCGEVFPVTRSPKPGSPVCPDCKRIFEGMPTGGD